MRTGWELNSSSSSSSDRVVAAPCSHSRYVCGGDKWPLREILYPPESRVIIVARQVPVASISLFVVQRKKTRWWGATRQVNRSTKPLLGGGVFTAAQLCSRKVRKSRQNVLMKEWTFLRRTFSHAWRQSTAVPMSLKKNLLLFRFRFCFSESNINSQPFFLLEIWGRNENIREAEKYTRNVGPFKQILNVSYNYYLYPFVKAYKGDAISITQS